MTEHLLASAVDALHIANWLNSEDGKRKRNRPDPIPRPGVKKHNTKKYGSTRMSLADADSWLASEGVTYAEVANDLVA